MTFEEIKVGEKFRISGGLESYTKVEEQNLDGKVINSEFSSGPYKNEFLEVYPDTRVRKISK